MLPFASGFEKGYNMEIEKLTKKLNLYERVILKIHKRLFMKIYKLGITFGFNNK